MTTKLTIGFLLAGITLALYWPVGHFEIVDFDDSSFTIPPEGFQMSWSGFWRQAAMVKAVNWHPVTNTSFFLAHALFGFNPGAEHLLNAGIHAANDALLFLLLFNLTGCTWRSATVAAIFAWHPLRVESVAWISERKDVLYFFFMMLSMLCYASYAKSKSVRSYVLSLLFFIVSFCCKGMVVTLPFLLLLLDLWPLQRLDRSNVKRVVIEKIPFFALAILFCAWTFWIHATHADVTNSQFGLFERFENAVMSYVNYLGLFFWPAGLAIPYPYPSSFDISQVLLSALFLVAVSVFCLIQISRRPCLAFGWLWYLITLLPVIGLVQVGGQAMADRYTYASLIGPVISLVWIVSELVASRTTLKAVSATACVVILSAFAISTRIQMSYWRNTITLFSHTIAVTPENFVAELCLALGFEESGHLRLAATQYRAALKASPNDYETNYRLATCLDAEGYHNEALRGYETAVSDGCNKDDFGGDVILADCLLKLGRSESGESYMQDALRINPNAVMELNNLAWLLSTSPDSGFRNGTEAVELATRGCQLTNYKETQEIGTLGAAYAEAGRFDDAISTSEKACELARQQGETNLLKTNEQLLQLFQQHKPYHETTDSASAKTASQAASVH